MTRYKNSHVDYIGHGIVPFYPCLYTWINHVFSLCFGSTVNTQLPGFVWASLTNKSVALHTVFIGLVLCAPANLTWSYFSRVEAVVLGEEGEQDRLTKLTCQIQWDAWCWGCKHSYLYYICTPWVLLYHSP
jgi:hypothetical protein